MTQEDEEFNRLERESGLRKRMLQDMKVEGPTHVVCRCDKCKIKQEQDKPVALVTGVYGGRFTYAPIKASVVLPVGMALYTHPQPRKPVKFPTMLRKMWSGGDVQAWLDEHVNKE